MLYFKSLWKKSNGNGVKLYFAVPFFLQLEAFGSVMIALNFALPDLLLRLSIAQRMLGFYFNEV